MNSNLVSDHVGANLPISATLDDVKDEIKRLEERKLITPYQRLQIGVRLDVHFNQTIDKESKSIPITEVLPVIRWAEQDAKVRIRDRSRSKSYSKSSRSSRGSRTPRAR